MNLFKHFSDLPNIILSFIAYNTGSFFDAKELFSVKEYGFDFHGLFLKS